MVHELGILAVIHSPDLGHDSWQVLIEGEHCVPISDDFRSRSVIRSRYDLGGPTPRTVPRRDVPREKFDSVQAALGAFAP